MLKVRQDLGTNILTFPIALSLSGPGSAKKRNKGPLGEEKAGTEVPVIFDYNEMCQA